MLYGRLPATVQRTGRMDVIGATHTHFANVCAIGNLLIDDLGLGQDVWPDVGAEDLLAPYDSTCSPEAFSIDEAMRLTSLYVVAFFKLHLMGEEGYEQYLTTDYAEGEPAIDFSTK